MRPVTFICGDSRSKIVSNNSYLGAVRLTKAISMHRSNSRVCVVANGSLHCSGYNQAQANNACNNDTYFRHSLKTFCGTCRSLERTRAHDPVVLVAPRTFQSVGVVAQTLSLNREAAHGVPSRASNIFAATIQLFLALDAECGPRYCNESSGVNILSAFLTDSE